MSHKDNVEKAVKVNLGNENALRRLIEIAFERDIVYIDDEGEIRDVDNGNSIKE